MKPHLLISIVLLASFVVVSSLPEDYTVLGARDTSIVQQSLKSVDLDPPQPLSELSEVASFDKALKSTSDELLVAKKKRKKGSSGKSSKKKKKPKNQKNKGKKGKASPAKTKKQKK